MLATDKKTEMNARENSRTVKIAPIKSTWGTPPKLYKKLDKRFKFDEFDPAPYPEPEWDGLEIDWAERTFVNPPFDNLSEWIEKAYDEYRKGKLIVMLSPVRTHTSYFQQFVLPYASLEFIPGRLRFADLTNGAKIDKACGFGCCLIIWDGLKWSSQRAIEKQTLRLPHPHTK